MGRKNIKISEELFDALSDEKRDGENWSHCIRRNCMADPVDPDAPNDTEKSASITDERLRRIERSAKASEERTGRIEQMLEQMRG